MIRAYSKWKRILNQFCSSICFSRSLQCLLSVKNASLELRSSNLKVKDFSSIRLGRKFCFVSFNLFSILSFSFWSFVNSLSLANRASLELRSSNLKVKDFSSIRLGRKFCFVSFNLFSILSFSFCSFVNSLSLANKASLELRSSNLKVKDFSSIRLGRKFCFVSFNLFSILSFSFCSFVNSLSLANKASLELRSSNLKVKDFSSIRLGRKFCFVSFNLFSILSFSFCSFVNSLSLANKASLELRSSNLKVKDFSSIRLGRKFCFVSFNLFSILSFSFCSFVNSLSLANKASLELRSSNLKVKDFSSIRLGRKFCFVSFNLFSILSFSFCSFVNSLSLANKASLELRSSNLKVKDFSSIRLGRKFCFVSFNLFSILSFSFCSFVNSLSLANR